MTNSARYILKFDTEGRLTDVVATVVDGKPVLSPDNPLLAVPANPAAKMPVFNLKRSGGFEGLAMSKDGSKLYGLLEGALYQDDGKMETVDGHTAIRVIEFDIGFEELDRSQLALSVRRQGCLDRRLQHAGRCDRPRDRARQRSGHEGQGLRRSQAAEAGLLRGSCRAQAHLQDRVQRRQCRQGRAQDRLYRPDATSKTPTTRRGRAAATASTTCRS